MLWSEAAVLHLPLPLAWGCVYMYIVFSLSLHGLKNAAEPEVPAMDSLKACNALPHLRAPLYWFLSGSSHGYPQVQSLMSQRFLLRCSRSLSLAALVPELPVVATVLQLLVMTARSQKFPWIMRSLQSQLGPRSSSTGHSERFMPWSSLRCSSHGCLRCTALCDM